MSKPAYQNEEWLKTQYCGNGLKQSEIAEKCGVSRTTIVRWMERHSIPARDRDAYFKDEKYRDADWLHQKYHEEGLSQREVAKECGATVATIARWMENLEVEARTQSESLSGERHPFWGTSREFSEEHKENMSKCRMGEKHHFYGKQLSEEHKQNISEALSGREATESQLENLRKYWAHIQEHGRSEETIKNMVAGAKHGEDNPRWAGGYDPYSSGKWLRKRKEALERADYTCEHPDCDKGPEEIGHNPHVHHIIPARHFEDSLESHTLDNLVSLCPSHHFKLDQLILFTENTHETTRRTTL